MTNLNNTNTNLNPNNKRGNTMNKLATAIALVIVSSSATAGVSNTAQGSGYGWSKDMIPGVTNSTLQCTFHGWHHNDRENNRTGMALQGEVLGQIKIDVLNNTPRVRSVNVNTNQEVFNFAENVINMDYTANGGILPRSFSTRMEGGTFDPCEDQPGTYWDGTQCYVNPEPCETGYHHVWQNGHVTGCAINGAPRSNAWSRWNFTVSNITTFEGVEGTQAELSHMTQSMRLEMDNVSGDKAGTWHSADTTQVADRTFYPGGFHTDETRPDGYNTGTKRMHGHWAAEMTGQQTSTGDWQDGHSSVWAAGEYSCQEVATFAPLTVATRSGIMEGGVTGTVTRSSLPSSMQHPALKEWMEGNQDNIVETDDVLQGKATVNWKETSTIIAAPNNSGSNSNSQDCHVNGTCLTHEGGSGSMGLGLALLGIFGAARRFKK